MTPFPRGAGELTRYTRGSHHGSISLQESRHFPASFTIDGINGTLFLEEDPIP